MSSTAGDPGLCRSHCRSWPPPPSPWPPWPWPPPLPPPWPPSRWCRCGHRPPSAQQVEVERRRVAPFQRRVELQVDGHFCRSAIHRHPRCTCSCQQIVGSGRWRPSIQAFHQRTLSPSGCSPVALADSVLIVNVIYGIVWSLVRSRSAVPVDLAGSASLPTCCDVLLVYARATPPQTAMS